MNNIADNTDSFDLMQSKRRERYEADLSTVLSTPEGRRVFYRTIVESGILSETAFSNDPIIMSFQNGKRSSGLEMLVYLFNAHPEVLIQMKKEYEQEMK